jgi:hypothetical protein
MSEPEFQLHCKRCGGAFIEMVALLFHHCGEPVKRQRQRRKAPKVRLNGRRRETA